MEGDELAHDCPCVIGRLHETWYDSWLVDPKVTSALILLKALDLPGLRLGVIPARAELALFPGHAFSIFDSEQVKVETYASGLNITDKAEIAVYEKAFTLLERSAAYGDDARALIEAELHALG
ncbi:hypothetical protein J4032_04380 [Streptomyces formicae]|uniref:DUF5753 domain-containing protein n=1 Tax=Streptomyces formicae TaxID=1616117 RepID=A0ABY3WHB7_9ACTN|nr:Scr1 family TA system antitoxin-like transcriptional regulator [Streptomyces formicae]UNM10854.1 hypothetical protein J4032_04380 [Streptomyces formicae]